MQPFLNDQGGIKSGAQAGLSRLADSMKGETNPEAKLYELQILASTMQKEFKDEFIHKGGIAIIL